jgi:hypothetical protein
VPVTIIAICRAMALGQRENCPICSPSFVDRHCRDDAIVVAEGATLTWWVFRRTTRHRDGRLSGRSSHHVSQMAVFVPRLPAWSD